MHRFKHKITGTESRRRLPECRGGLLSDEMGMGKSCSVLALIVHSLEQAELFKATPQFDRDLSLGQRRCRATLVVTPKSSMHTKNLSNASSDYSYSNTKLAFGN